METNAGGRGTADSPRFRGYGPAMTRGQGMRMIGVSALCAALQGCGDSRSLTGDEVARDLVTAMHNSQFYKSASRAECEPVKVKAGAISDCTVWFRKPIFMGDTSRKHPGRVTIDDDSGHFTFNVGA